MWSLTDCLPVCSQLTKLHNLSPGLNSTKDKCFQHTTSVIKARIALRKRPVKLTLTQELECKHESKKGRKKSRFKGHGWSKKGTKRSRKEQRLTQELECKHESKKGRKKSRFKGHGWSKKGTKRSRKEQRSNKSFDNLTYSHEHMYNNVPPPRDIPLSTPPVEYVYSHEDETYVVDVPLGSEVIAAAMPECIDYVIGKQQTTEVIEMLEHIKRIQTNQILDPSTCKDTDCKYSRGDLLTQRYVLLERLYQLNCVIAQQNRKQTHSNKHSQR